MKWCYLQLKVSAYIHKNLMLPICPQEDMKLRLDNDSHVETVVKLVRR